MTPWLTIVLILIAISVTADVLAPYGYSIIHLEARLGSPSAQYLPGTDQLGRDVPEPTDLRRAYVVIRRTGSDHPQCCRRYRDRRSYRIRRR